MTGEDKRMKIAILTANTLQNRKRSSWGGTVDHIALALQKHCGDVYFIDPVQSRARLIGKIIHKLTRLFLGKNYLYNHTLALASKYAQVGAPQLADLSP